MYNAEAFKKSVSHDLIPTNLEGAFASSPPPDDLDLSTASAATLVRHGFLWRRPQPGDAPGVATAWKQLLARKWHSKDRIVPHLEPQRGRTHLSKNLKKQSAGSYTNTAWSGGFLQAGPWSSVIGYWHIPTVSEPSEPQGTEPGGGWKSSSWLGLDGAFISNDVLQAGIEQFVNIAGQASYVAWYEWYAPVQPTSPPYIYQTNITNFPVSPGQQVYCSVQYINNKTAGYIYFANEATGQHFSITLAPPPGANFNGDTAEWIMEAPDGGEPFTSIPKFAPVQFTSAISCGPNSTTGNPQNGNTVNLTTASEKLLTNVVLGSDTVTINFIG